MYPPFNFTSMDPAQVTHEPVENLLPLLAEQLHHDEALQVGLVDADQQEVGEPHPAGEVGREALLVLVEQNDGLGEYLIALGDFHCNLSSIQMISRHTSTTTVMDAAV